MARGKLAALRGARFLVFGRAGMDLYADPPGERIETATRFTSALGGSAANIAAGVARLGGAAALISAVSDDAIGRFVMNELRRYGVGVEHVRAVGGGARNSLAVVETRSEDCQSIIYRNNASDFQVNAAQVEAVDWSAFGALIVTGTSFAFEPSRGAAQLAIARAARAGLATILDADYRPYSWASAEESRAIMRAAAHSVDIVIGNDEDFDVMAGARGLSFARELAAETADLVIYKQGARGSISLTGEESFETPVFPVKALKPTGAGDAFLAGLAVALSQGRPLREALARGSAAAAIVVTRVGCAPATPTADELEAFLAAHAAPGA